MEFVEISLRILIISIYYKPVQYNLTRLANITPDCIWDGEVRVSAENGGVGGERETEGG